MGEHTPEWYYVGHYGQLGPLTEEQMIDLASDGVIDQQTFVWKEGMSNWQTVAQTQALQARMSEVAPMESPYKSSSPQPIVPPHFEPSQPKEPPTPPQTTTPPQQMAPNPREQLSPQNPYQKLPDLQAHAQVNKHYWQHDYVSVPTSDKSRASAALLSIIPGAGRFYLGYSAHGVLQLLTFLFCGVGLLWSWIDGLYILTGGLKYDGYGRIIKD